MKTEKMKKQIYHEGYNYVLEYDNNSLIMYKEDIDEWMGDIEYIKVFTVEGWSGPANSDSVLRCIQPDWMDTRMTKRRNFSDKFKATVALEALRGDKTVQEIASKRQLHPTQVSTWKRQAIEGMANVFSDKVKKAEKKDGEI